MAFPEERSCCVSHKLPEVPKVMHPGRIGITAHLDKSMALVSDSNQIRSTAIMYLGPVNPVGFLIPCFNLFSLEKGEGVRRCWPNFARLKPSLRPSHPLQRVPGPGHSSRWPPEGLKRGSPSREVGARPQQLGPVLKTFCRGPSSFCHQDKVLNGKNGSIEGKPCTGLKSEMPAVQWPLHCLLCPAKK